MKKSIRRTIAVVGIGLGLMILGMIWSIVNTALASIQRDLGATILNLQWMMNSFGIFMCVPLLTMGKLGDSYGRKRLFIIGLVIALIASILAGMTTHIVMLIACMGLFGLAGSIILPLSQALLVHQYPESQKQKAIGLWSIFGSLSLALGPLVGGILLNFLSWRWVYLINIPSICLVLPLIYFFVEKEKIEEKPHCDWTGVGLLAVIVGSLIVAIMQGPSWGWTSVQVLGLFGLTALSSCALVAIERKSSAPLFRPDLFLQKSFLFSAIANGCTIGFIWVAFFLIPLYLQNMKQYTPFETGLTLLLVTLPVALLSVQVSQWYNRVGARTLLFCGFGFFVLSSLIQILFFTGDTFWPIGLGCFFLGMGWVLAWGPSISCAISSLPHRLAGMASGMFTTLQELGAVLSLAIGGVIFQLGRKQILDPHMDEILPSIHGFTADRTESFLSNPVAVEKAFGSDSPIVAWVQQAFLHGYQATLWFLLALGLFAALMTCFLPKKKKLSL